MKLWYDTMTNQIIMASMCQSGQGGYTFYKTRSLSKQGKRVRMRPAQWFEKRADAEKALDKYCTNKQRYKHIAVDEILKRLNVKKPKQYNPIFSDWI